MLFALHNLLISLTTSISSKSAEYFLDTGALQNLLSFVWCLKNGTKFKTSETFGVQLAHELEVPEVGKVHCFVDSGPMKTGLIFHVLDCNVLYVLGISFDVSWANATFLSIRKCPNASQGRLNTLKACPNGPQDRLCR